MRRSLRNSRVNDKLIDWFCGGVALVLNSSSSGRSETFRTSSGRAANMNTEFQNIKFRIEDRVARITFARPPLNILNIAMMREISAALNQCALQRDLAAIVFDAAEGTRAFSAGVAVEEHVAETVFQMLDSFHSIFRALVQISKPVIGVIDGPAFAGGCELVAACDIVIASDRARFGQPEIKLGVFPPVAAILLPRLIGDKKAREMILLGEIIDTNRSEEHTSELQSPY